jgi:hypothetical protein
MPVTAKPRAAKDGVVATRGEPADRGSAREVSGPHEWPPPEEGVARYRRVSSGGQACKHRTMKKSEKNRITASAIFFNRTLPTALATRA